MSFTTLDDGTKIVGTYTADKDCEIAPGSTGAILWIRNWNPRVYNVDFSFEMVPDPNNIDRAKDLKLWMPAPREWDSQKNVKVISVQPEPHARYVDPEYGNPILFWDFGKMPEQIAYKVDIAFSLESYDINVEVDPERVGSYDKTSKEYALYTRSTHTISITPKVKELAQVVIGDEENPYIQAGRIVNFVHQKVRYTSSAFERGRGIDYLLASPVTDGETGQEYYEGRFGQIMGLTVALCRAVGIPARCVFGYIRLDPWIDQDDLKARYPVETELSSDDLAAMQTYGALVPDDSKARFPVEAKLSPDGLAATQTYGAHVPYMWSEFFVPNYGWIPADAIYGTIGQQDNRRLITHKGRDIQLGPHAPQGDSEGYGVQWVALHNGRADTLFYGALNIAKIRTSKVKLLHH
jgi:transglutaminase-like putative cysteine protease